MKLIKKFYKIVFGYKEKLYFFLLIIASILNFFVEFLSLGLILPLIGLLVNPSSFIESVINFFPKLIFIKDYINLNDPHFIYYFLGVFVVLFLLKNLYSVVFFLIVSAFDIFDALFNRLRGTAQRCAQCAPQHAGQRAARRAAARAYHYQNLLSSFEMY